MGREKVAKSKSTSSAESLQNKIDEAISVHDTGPEVGIEAISNFNSVFCSAWPVARPALAALQAVSRLPARLIIGQVIAAGDAAFASQCRAAPPGADDDKQVMSAAASIEALRGIAERLVRLGSDPSSISRIQATAAQAMRRQGLTYPHNACAATLSAFLIEAGVRVPMTLGAGNLAARLRNNQHWQRVAIGMQRPGDVGVRYDRTSPVGADHVYLVVERHGDDEMMIADNQVQGRPHTRHASGRGKTPTEYFLRAPAAGERIEAMSDAVAEEIPDEDTNALPEPFMDDGTPRL